VEKWEFSSDHVLCLYKVEVHPESSIHDAAEKIARYASVGLKSNTDLAEKFSAKVISFHELAPNQGIIIVAYPPEMFDIDTGGIASLLTIMAGWNTSVSDILSIRIYDIFLPKNITEKFLGPQFSQAKINDLLHVKQKNLYLHVPIYPRLGVSIDLYKEVLDELLFQSPYVAPDIIADSELLLNPYYCPIHERVKLMQNKNKDLVNKMSSLKDKIDKLGGKTLFLVNVTGTPTKAIENATLVKNAGLDGIMVNVLTTGFSLLEELRSKFKDLIIFAYTNMHAIITRGKKTGMSYEVIAKLLKLAGADIIYTGAPYGSLDLTEPLKEHITNIQKYNSIVRSEIFNIKPSLPSIAGGINLGNLEVNIKLAGIPTEIVVGDGIYSFPQPKHLTIRLFKKALITIEEMKKSMWTDNELSSVRRSNEEYFKKFFVDSSNPTDAELREALKKNAILKLEESL
jgi:ribulose 1,5-bisphosphate carboxylase large subunit-like protein